MDRRDTFLAGRLWVSLFIVMTLSLGSQLTSGVGVCTGILVFVFADAVTVITKGVWLQLPL